MMRTQMSFAAALVAAFGMLAASSVQADGRIEINQTSVDAAGGFPFTISSPGNYVLTSSLTVPAGTDGLVLMTNEVVFDLNGFSISGPATCNATSCAAGAGIAIRGLSGIAHARRVTLRNGTIRGFADNCIQLGPQALVESLLVTECGRNGIAVSGGSILLRNRVLQTGENGLSMASASHPPTYAHNTISDVSLGGTGFYGVSGGRASAGNSCSDRSCSPQGKRRFYLTSSQASGASAGTACATGFRVAGLGEMMDPTALYYEPNLGFLGTPGPPYGSSGWIYSGPTDHCSNFTTITGVGTTAELANHDRPNATVPPWDVLVIPCGLSEFTRVWCIEQ